MNKTTLSTIMKRAWEIKKEDKNNVFAICLKMAWEESKKPSITNMQVWDKCEDVAELIKDKVGADYVKVSRNEYKQVHNNIQYDRSYYTIRAYRKGKIKREIPCGYYDKIKGEYVPMQNKTFEATNVFEYGMR